MISALRIFCNLLRSITKSWTQKKAILYSEYIEIMIALISKEWRDTGSNTRNIVVRELYKWQELRLVVLLVVNISRDIVQVFGLYT